MVTTKRYDVKHRRLAKHKSWGASVVDCLTAHLPLIWPLTSFTSTADRWCPGCWLLASPVCLHKPDQKDIKDLQLWAPSPEDACGGERATILLLSGHNYLLPWQLISAGGCEGRAVQSETGLIPVRFTLLLLSALPETHIDYVNTHTGCRVIYADTAEGIFFNDTGVMSESCWGMSVSCPWVCSVIKTHSLRYAKDRVCLLPGK